MAGLCKCEATKEQCDKIDICKRQKYDGEVMDFKTICNEKNKYFWFKEIETSITETKE